MPSPPPGLPRSERSQAVYAALSDVNQIAEGRETRRSEMILRRSQLTVQSILGLMALFSIGDFIELLRDDWGFDISRTHQMIFVGVFVLVVAWLVAKTLFAFSPPRSSPNRQSGS